MVYKLTKIFRVFLKNVKLEREGAVKKKNEKKNINDPIKK